MSANSPQTMLDIKQQGEHVLWGGVGLPFHSTSVYWEDLTSGGECFDIIVPLDN